MLHLIALTTGLFVIVTGVYVLARGEWRPFKLKFGGVCISTTAAIYMMFAAITFHGLNYCTNETLPAMCLTFELYYIARNTALILFHIAIGRDTIQYRKRERRGATCPRSFSTLSPH